MIAAPLRSGEPVRFLALGDQGKGNDRQSSVGAAMAKVCEARGGCAFALLLGDNFYPTGVGDTSDPQWQSAFERPYAALPIPFWAVLGNHDYGGGGAGWETWRAQAQLDYARTSTKWRMPARHYAFAEGVVDVFALDTNAIAWGFIDDQAAAMSARLASATRGWKVVMGHHPYRSNGRHGNAGTYDNRCAAGACTCDSSLARVPCGVHVKAFLDAHVCGKADVYLAGHDHNLQDLGKVCGTEHFVSGAGANTTPVTGTQPHAFQSDASGFFLFEASADHLVATAFDASARALHTRTITR